MRKDILAITLSFLVVLSFFVIYSCEDQGGLPSGITTTAISYITTATAISGGDITNDGGLDITARGVCWSTSTNPTIADAHTTDGIVTGNFTSSLTGLTESTTYYVRAYATNEIGTTYGNEMSFETKETLTDYDGNVYQIVQIGNQTWMAENLMSTKYADGSSIPLITDNAVWNALSDDYHDTDRAYCYYNNSMSPGHGALYTWAAAMDGANYSSTNPSGVQGACPTGWHLPSYYEWKEMLDFLGGDVIAGPKLKATGMEYWDSPNNVATNESGFSAIPAGYRDEYGDFESFNSSGAWWDTDRASTILGYSHWLHAGYDKVYQSNVRQSRGLSIRCVKD